MTRARQAFAVLGILGLAAVAGAEAPLRVVLLIDTSGSIARRDAPRRAQAAEELTRALPPGSQVAVFAFDDKPRLVLPMTGSPEAVNLAVAELKSGGHFTALNDAIFDAVRYLSESPSGRRAIVAVTDGVDENSALNPDDGATAAREAAIPVFSLGIGRVQDRSLRRVAKLTGGEYYPPGTSAADVAKALAEAAAPAPATRVAPAAAATGAASATAVVPIEGAASPASAVSDAPSRAIVVGVSLAALAMALLTLGFVLLRRPAPAPGPAPTRPTDLDEDELDVSDDDTIMMRAEALEDPASKTLVLTLKPLLHVTRGSDQGRFFEVGFSSATSIGRAVGNDIVLDDRAISSQHCRIRPGAQGYEIVDLKSTNGTYVNERRISRHRLRAGDVIKMGETLVQFRMDHMKE
jgi:hypothetical protein